MGPPGEVPLPLLAMPPTKSSSIDVLVESARVHDAHARNELFHSHRDRVSRLVRLRLGRRQLAPFDVEDVVQDAWLKAFQNLHLYVPADGDGFAHWLSELALNVLRDRTRYLRRERRDARRAVSLEGGDRRAVGDTLACDGPDPATDAAERESSERLADCIRALPADQSEAIRLHFFLGQPFDVVGERLGRSAAAAEQLTRRARERLAVLFAGLPGRRAG